MPMRASIASSLIGGCVPSAIKTSNALAAFSPRAIRSCSTRNITSIGAERVWSGTIIKMRRPRTFQPAISAAHSSRTFASSRRCPFCPTPVTRYTPE